MYSFFSYCEASREHLWNDAEAKTRGREATKLSRYPQAFPIRHSSAFNHPREHPEGSQNNHIQLLGSLLIDNNQFISTSTVIFSCPFPFSISHLQGEYDKVVRDYKRASSLSSHTNVKIFQKVANEAQVIIEDFTKQLLKSLEDPTLFREEHDRIISLLVELGSKVDPTLHYLVNQTKWICAMLDEKSEQYYNPIISKKRAISSAGSSSSTSSAPSTVASNKIKLLTEVVECAC